MVLEREGGIVVAKNDGRSSHDRCSYDLIEM